MKKSKKSLTLRRMQVTILVSLSHICAMWLVRKLS